MSLGLLSSSPKTPMDKSCTNSIGSPSDQPCNVTDDSLGSDCYESMHAFKKIRTSTSGLRKSPNKWTKEENQKLASLVSSYGEKKWKRISAEMGGQKTGAQCAQHWKRVLSPEIRKGHWDENEEDLLLRLVVQYGSCWKKIAKKIPQRTDIQCRYQYLKAKQSREVMWDAKEDESLIKKVMEMANCNFFQSLDGNNSNNNNNSNINNNINNSTTTTTISTSISSPSLPLPLSPSPLSPLSSASDSSPILPHKMNFNNNSPLFVSSPLRNSNLFNNNNNINNVPSLMLAGPVVSRPMNIINNNNNKEREKERESEDTNSSLSSSSGSEKEEINFMNKMKLSGEFFEKERERMKMSGEMMKSNNNSWNDDKNNINMSDSPDWRNNNNNNNIKDERMCANCRSPFINHINKVVWLEISEHMARLKLTSTLRTALECKSRFTELLGNKMFGAPSPSSSPFTFPNIPSSSPEGINPIINNNNSNTINNNINKIKPLKSSTGFTIPSHPLGGSGGINNNNTNNTNNNNADENGIRNGIKGFPTLSENIGIKINNNNTNNNNNNNNSSNNNNIKSSPPGNNINLTNCNNNNITINITNSYTTQNTTQNGINYQQITHSAPPSLSSSSSPSLSSLSFSSPPSSSFVPPLKTESLLGPSHLLSKANTILSPAPPFPSFSIPSFPHLPPPSPSLSIQKPAPLMRASVHTSGGGLESLAAVASILPREMLADYF